MSEIIPIPNKRIKDLTNNIYGKLKVRGYVGKDSHNRAKWLCDCECGGTKTVVSQGLISEKTTSCGCLELENRRNNVKPGGNIKHSMSRDRIYKIWSDMKIRCNDLTNPNYGGRGITYDPNWELFCNFYNDMNDSYDESLTLERIDVNSNYTKDNCTWATSSEQAKNKTNTIKVKYKGENYILIDLYNKLKPDIKYGTIKNRIKYGGWNVEKAFNTPPDISRRDKNG